MHLFLEEYDFKLAVPNSLKPVHTRCCDIAAELRNNLIYRLISAGKTVEILEKTFFWRSHHFSDQSAEFSPSILDFTKPQLNQNHS